MALVLDTGPVVALLNADDPDHSRCVELVESSNEDLVLPALVLVEVDYWLMRLGGTEAWKVFVEDVAQGAYRLEHLDERDLLRAAELEAAYSDLTLGLVDAAVVTVCERLGETKVGTLDRRQFSIVRPRHCPALEILPE